MSETTMGFVSFDEIASEISESEYSSFSNLLARKGYVNDADQRPDGHPIDVDDFILAGIDIFDSIVGGE